MSILIVRIYHSNIYIIIFSNKRKIIIRKDLNIIEKKNLDNNIILCKIINK